MWCYWTTSCPAQNHGPHLGIVHEYQVLHPQGSLTHGLPYDDQILDMGIMLCTTQCFLRL